MRLCQYPWGKTQETAAKRKMARVVGRLSQDLGRRGTVL